MNQLLELTNTFSPTKSDIEQLSTLLAEQALDGADPIRLSIQLTALIKTAEAAKDKINTIVLDELAKYGGKTTMLGAKIDACETGIKMDYSNSEAWRVCYAKEMFWNNRRKDIEALAKSCPDGSSLLFTDTVTGESWEVVKPAKSSTSSYKITLGA